MVGRCVCAGEGGHKEFLVKQRGGSRKKKVCEPLNYRESHVSLPHYYKLYKH